MLHAYDESGKIVGQCLNGNLATSDLWEGLGYTVTTGVFVDSITDYKYVEGVLTEKSTEEKDAQTVARKWYDIRKKRNNYLYLTDWANGNDTSAKLTGQDKQDAKDYRILLRDIPQTYSDDPDSVVWPTIPTCLEKSING